MARSSQPIDPSIVVLYDLLYYRCAKCWYCIVQGQHESTRMMRSLLALLGGVVHVCLCFLASIKSALAYAPLKGVRVKAVQPTDGSSPSSSPSIDIGKWLSVGKNNKKERRMVVFGTYAADFNAIEYGQRLRYYWPRLREEKGVGRCAFLLSCQPDAALELARQVDLDVTGPDAIELWTDNAGAAARKFGVERGWLPDNDDVNPFLKLFGMLWGLGAWATLPAVIGGYIGNPFIKQPWIEDALAVGARQGRWPDNALTMDAAKSVVVKNKFDDLPLVGSWPRRPLELATLRLQSMLGISLKHWDALAPDEEALAAGVLTQLGGCLIVDADGETVLFEWKDPGICAVANFEDMLKKLDSPKRSATKQQTITK